MSAESGAGPARVASVLLLGTFDPTTPRARQYMRLLTINDTAVQVHNEPVWAESRLDDAERPTVRRGLRLLRAWTGCAVALTRTKADLVVFLYPGHLDAIALGWLARLRRVPTVLDAFVSLYDTIVLDRALASPRSVLGRTAKLADSLACRSVSVVVTDTHQNAEFLSALTGVPRGRFRELPVGADSVAFAERKGTVPQAGRVLFYGTYIPLHGADVIVRAAAELEDEQVHVVLIGKGQTRTTVERLAKETGVSNVSFKDPVPEAELADEIAKSSACLGIFGTTSKAQRVVPNKVFQCVSMGRPVVTEDSPAIREAFEDDLVLVPAGSPSALAAGIRQALGPVGLLAKTRASDRFRRHYDDAALAPRLREILTAAHSTRRRRAR